LESPAIAGRRSPASGTAPPSLVSILIRVRHVAGVSPESHSFPARVAAFRVGPLGDASSPRGGAGGCGARRTQRPTAGAGRGRAADHPATGGSGQAYLAGLTLGPGLESPVAPVSGGSLRSRSKLPLAALSSDECERNLVDLWSIVGSVGGHGLPQARQWRSPVLGKLAPFSAWRDFRGRQRFFAPLRMTPKAALWC